jgi:transcriptional regulator with XRE-family HTH domain
MTSFADRIRALRGHLSSADFAKKIGISSGALSSYELGKSVPSGKKLIHISEQLGVTIEWLLHGAPAQSEPATVAGFQNNKHFEIIGNTNLNELQPLQVLPDNASPERGPDSPKGDKETELLINSLQTIAGLHKTIGELHQTIGDLRVDVVKLQARIAELEREEVAKLQARIAELERELVELRVSRPQVAPGTGLLQVEMPVEMPVEAPYVGLLAPIPKDEE